MKYIFIWLFYEIARALIKKLYWYLINYNDNH